MAASAVLAVPAVGVTGNLCDPVEYRVENGTTIDYTLTEDCDLASYTIDTTEGGSPTVTYKPSGNGLLVWHQAVEKTESACESGWGESWQQWARAGQGGPVCVKDIVWGVGPRFDGSLSITINTADDEIDLVSTTDNYTYVYGCNWIQDPASTNALENTCPAVA